MAEDRNENILKGSLFQRKGVPDIQNGCMPHIMINKPALWRGVQPKGCGFGKEQPGEGQRHENRELSQGSESADPVLHWVQRGDFLCSVSELPRNISKVDITHTTPTIRVPTLTSSEC